MWAGKGEFPVSQTHRIAFMPGNHLLVSSEGRGWRNLYASLATEQSWSATVRPVDHLCLAYCVSGSAHIKRRILGTGQTHAADLRPRSFGSIPSGVESGWQVNGTPQVMLLYLRRALIDQVVNDVFEGDARRVEIRPILGEGEPLLEQLSLAVLASLRMPFNFDNRLYIDTLAHTIAVQALYALGSGVVPQRMDRAAKGGISSAGVRRVLDYIETALDDDLSIVTLARVADYSPHFFARSFKKQVGQTLHQYVLQRRIERAKHLLLASDQVVGQIAAMSGFSSQSHLTSTFKRVFGVTPAAFRAENGRPFVVIKR